MAKRRDEHQALASALGELFAHDRGNPQILSWEVFNEPDFDVWNGKVSQASMSNTGKRSPPACMRTAPRT